MASPQNFHYVNPTWNAPIQNVTPFQFRFLCFQNKSPISEEHLPSASKKRQKGATTQVLIQNTVADLFLLPHKGLIKNTELKHWLICIQADISEIKESKIKVTSN